jgi:hypothetical protein
MDAETSHVLALGTATGLLVAVVARVVVLPLEFLPVAVPLVLGGGVVAGAVVGTTLPRDSTRAGRLGALAGGAGGLALAGSLWVGMATLAPLPDGTPVWALAYLFATRGPVSASSSPLASDLLVLAYALVVLAVHAAGGAVGARLAVLRRRRATAVGDERRQ